MRRLLVLLLAAFFPVCGFGQTAATGALVGTTTDASGAVVPGVKVTATNQATSVSRTTTSDETGVYRLPLLPPGRYSVEFSTQGFKTQTKPDIGINVTESVTLNAQLEVGQIAESVTVQGAVALVQTESTTLGGIVGEQAVKNLPLTNRNYTQILSLSPGVASDVNNAAGLGRNTQEVNVNGGRVMDNNFQMDGVNISNNQTGRAGSVVSATGIAIPNPDTIQEFKVQTSLYDSGYGRGAGANVNVVTKSGTNEFHGNVFEFFRNERLNANDFFLNRNNQPRSVLKQNQFGFTLGGPVRHDKLFFFGSYQGTRQVNAVGSASLKSTFLPALTNDRSAAGLGRLFAGQRGVNGGVPVAADGSNINPVALRLLNAKLSNGDFFVPTPQVIQASGLGFSVFSLPSRFTEDQFLINVDYLFSPKHTFAWRGFASRDPEIAAFTSGNVPGSGTTSDVQNRNAVLRLTSSLTATFLNEATFSVNRNFGRIQTQTPFKATDVGINTPSDDPIIPSMSVSGLFSLGGSTNDGQYTVSNTFHYADQVSWVRGRHSIRAGSDFERVQAPFDDPAITRGSLTFQSFPDFLLGMSAAQNGSQFSNVFSATGRTGITVRQFRVNNIASFFQDDFKVHPRLTLNLGVRWEIFGQVSDAKGILVNFWPNLATNDFSSSPAGSTFSGFVAAKNFPGTLPAGIVRNDNKTCCSKSAPKTNLGPRIGLAWRPLQTNNFVVRAGYGLFYTRTPVNDVFQLIVNQPFLITQTNQGVLNALSTFENPFNPGPPLPSQLPVWQPRTANTNLTMSLVDPDWDVPRSHQWSLNIQQELAGGVMLEAAYVGKRSERIEKTRSINQPRLASASNPINGETTNTLANARLRVPVIGFAPSGLSMRENYGFATFHSMQMNLLKRLSHGVQFQGAYTLSKAMTDVPGAGAFGLGGGITNNVFDRRQLWGLADFDRTHRFVLNYVWEFPGVNGGGGVLGTLLSGWSLSGVATLQTGQPLTILDQRAGSIYGFSNQRAQLCPGMTHDNIVGTGSVDSRIDAYFIPSAFCAPPVVGNGTDFGDLGRGVARGPDQRNLDMAVTKRTPVRFGSENSAIEFRTEFFNFTNTPQFAAPATNVALATFGRISATAVTPRLIQFALKYNF